MEVRKEEVEKLLGYEISEENFDEALGHAKRKQELLSKIDKRPVIMDHWYLVILIKEYVEICAFSRFTLERCKMLQDMEKERRTNQHGTPTSNHILSASVV